MKRAVGWEVGDTVKARDGINRLHGGDLGEGKVISYRCAEKCIVVWFESLDMVLHQSTQLLVLIGR